MKLLRKFFDMCIERFITKPIVEQVVIELKDWVRILERYEVSFEKHREGYNWTWTDRSTRKTVLCGWKKGTEAEARSVAWSVLRKHCDKER